METFILMIELWIEDVGFLGTIGPILFFTGMILLAIGLSLNDKTPRVH